MSDGRAYASSARAKTGALVPLFADGKPANSLYNPEREAERAAARLEKETFALFAGLADGRRVERFLAASPANECIIIEKTRADFSFLARLPAAASAMQSRRAGLFALCGESQDAREGACSLKDKILKAYIPALFRQFSLDILPSWQAHFPQEAEKIRGCIKEALAEISADFSAQARFGKIWMLNAAKNLYNGAKEGYPPCPSLEGLGLKGKKALVAAAGPSLDEAAAKIKEERGQLALFAADTALPALAKRGIAADFALSIDPQAISVRHFAGGLPKGKLKPMLIMDICASPAVAQRASRQGFSVILAAGSHPLSLCMASFAPLPRLETGSGTVTASAIDAAKRLGFKDISMAGADFAYTGGKPYCRGTYIEEAFYAECSRLSSAEGMHVALMFAGPVTSERREGGAITYKTPLLERYKEAVKGAPPPKMEWGDELDEPFPYKGFLFFFRDALRSLEKKLYIMEESSDDLRSSESPPKSLSKDEKRAFLSILPIASFYRARAPEAERKIILKSAINLALNSVEKYTRKL